MPGDQFSVSASNLPAPNTTFPRDIDPNFAGNHGIVPQVLPGFQIAVFAGRPDVRGPRWLCVAPNGDIFVAESGQGKITVLRDADSDGKAEIVSTFTDGLSKPHGMVIRNGALYVADTRAIWKFAYTNGDLVASGVPTRVTQTPDLRMTGDHWTREIAMDSKGNIYLAIGGRGDVLEDTAPNATIQIISPQGVMSTYAEGLRNVVGMAFYPGTDELWGTVNERDTLGGDLPPDYLAHIHKGDFFGWPYAYVGPHPDPVFGSKRPDLVTKTVTPDLLFRTPFSAAWFGLLRRKSIS